MNLANNYDLDALYAAVGIGIANLRKRVASLSEELEDANLTIMELEQKVVDLQGEIQDLRYELANKEI